MTRPRPRAPARSSKINGRFTVAGKGAHGDHILVLSGTPLRLRAVIGTGPDGVFEADRPARGPIALMGRARRERLALAAAKGDGDVAFDAAGPLHLLTVTVHSAEGYPEGVDVFLDPVELDDVPKELLPFASGVEPGVFSARFWEQRVSGRRLEVRLQSGIWRIGAAYIVGDRPNITRPDFKNYVAYEAIIDGEQLPRSGSGFAVDMHADRNARLELRELRDEEL